MPGSSTKSRRPPGPPTTPEPPTFLEPMKALASEAPPAGLWRCEIKFDGYRALAVLHGGGVELWSRNEKRLDAEFPEIVAALRRLKLQGTILDGEIVALDERGRSRFQALQARDSGARPILRYYVFDLPRLAGEDLRALPLEERQARLARLLAAAPVPLLLSPCFETEPAVLLAAAREQGLEGIVAKRPGSAYEAGRRSGAWVKCKVQAEQEFVIGGFTPPRGGRSHFGAILVGYHDERGRLVYAGRVGTGFDARGLAALHARFLPLRIADCPFHNLPLSGRSRFGRGMDAAEMRRVTWLSPELVAQVRFTEWTQEGLLRHPVFLALRADKDPEQVARDPAPSR